MDIPREQKLGLSFDGKAAFSKNPDDCASLLRMGIGAKYGDGVRLHVLEAAYLAERGKAEVTDAKGKRLDAKALLSKNGKGKGGLPRHRENGRARLPGHRENGQPKLSEQYAIFRAFRMGGQVVRFSSGSPMLWRVFARGVGREQDRPAMLLQIVDSKWKASLSSLDTALQTARLMRLELALGFVKDGKPSIIKLNRIQLEA